MLAIFPALSRIFLCLSFSFCSGFRCTVSELERKRLLSPPHRRRSSSLTLLRDSLYIIIIDILNWHGAVIAQSGRQSYEICSHKLLPKKLPLR
jgi:hypothetical protein